MQEMGDADRETTGGGLRDKEEAAEREVIERLENSLGEGKEKGQEVKEKMKQEKLF